MKPELHTEVTKSGILLDRELSQLTFNRRVMAQAEDPNIPLLERLRYLCIVSSNMDEFFEVRVASLLAAGSIGGTLAGHPALAANLQRIDKECHALVEQQYEILNNDVLPALRAAGVHLLRDQDRNEAQRAWVKDYFDREVRPLLTPIGLDPAHPFPQVINKSLNFIVSLSGKDAFGRGTAIAIVKAPRVLPRVIKLPDEISDGVSFCLLSSVIHAHISDLFAGREVIAYSQFRVTREIGYRLFDAKLSGRGYVTEACRLLVDYLFNVYQLHRLELLSTPDNVASIRVAQKCGFTAEGMMRQSFFINGAYQDVQIFSLLRPEWEAQRL